jgi:SHS2 domain-containing protein
MGAVDFCIKAYGKTAQEAFDSAVEEALYQHGHSGYTGSIAEKDNFVMIECPEGKDPEYHAYDLLEEDDSRVIDKYGPAGCIKAGENEYWFFGFAST